MPEEQKSSVSKTAAKVVGGISVITIIGFLLALTVNFSIEWYKEYTKAEHERLVRMEKQMEEINTSLAVIIQSQKDDESDENASWSKLQANTEELHEIKVQVRVNAILNERNHEDIRELRSKQQQPSKNKKQDTPKDVKELTELQKMWMRAMGSDKEKIAIAKEDKIKKNSDELMQLFKKGSEKPDSKTAEEFKEQHIRQGKK